MVVVRSSKGFMTVPFQSHWLENRPAGKTCADIKMWKYAELGKLSKKEVMDFQSGHFPFIIFLSFYFILQTVYSSRPPVQKCKEISIFGCFPFKCYSVVLICGIE